MNLKSFLRTGSAAVIAAALSFGAFPTIAHAADDNDRQGRGHATRGGDSPPSEARAQARQQQRAARAEQAPQQQRTHQAQGQQQRSNRAPAQQQRAAQAPAQQQRTYQAPAAQQRSGRTWNQSDRRGDTGASRSGRDWNRSSSGQADAAAQARAQGQGQVTARSGSQWNGSRSSGTSTRSGNWDRNRTYSNTTRNQTYRDGRQQTQNAYRSGYRDGNRTDGRRDGHRSWSHDWRRDNRYNWSGYRNANRNVYHLGRYYSPYSNYRYNRLSIGFTLNSLFFGSRYWINDPWQYRLPDAYGSYRWVRYYDDALLVDTYSGQVVDVIYDFFW